MRLKRRFAVLAVLALLPVEAADTYAQTSGQKETVVADVSTRSVSITSGFSGTEILIFGAVENSRQPSAEAGTYDIVVVVEGTPAPQVVRRKSNVAGLWINTSAMRFASFPSYYAIASTRPIDEIAERALLDKLEIGFEHVRLIPAGTGTRTAPQDAREIVEFREAAIRLKESEHLYTADYGVAFIGSSLFRSKITLPPNVPVGQLTARVYLFRDGQLLSQYTRQVGLERTGLERFLYDGAQKMPALYGIATVLFAIAAGMAAAFVFQRPGR